VTGCSEAIVLCGGAGTRLRSVSGATPKSMVDVGGRPFLEILLGYLQAQGVGRVVLATGIGHDIIAEWFGERWHSLAIAYSHENEPLGTGGALAQAMRRTSEASVLAVNGDTYFAFDAAELRRLHDAERADVTIALKHLTNFDRYGTVLLEGHRITSFLEKRPTEDGVINGGVYVLRREIFAPDLPTAFSFERDWLERRLATARVYGLAQDGYFIDIGIPEDYQRACHDLRARTFPRS
jgi:D-glycero-alpha-D-manno-heptose 1-phosphate guanylyltransferase